MEQINLQHRRFLSWLRKDDFLSVPIEKIAVYSRDDTYLRNLTNDKIISDIVMYRDRVLSKSEQMDDDAIGQLMTYVNDAEEPIEGARKWVEENQDLV
ncbi:MAG TPA: hypothetical protein VK097_00560 [Lentibacillus sp.]|uniref:hypothetical protein n=1 Tax=Lentibacillus sp. TaxID=1925746 RepID=UPI002B4B4F43|nr:hypothetical protein [Lentibacillus sp.]HLR60915.1 hypothetical protein [Lentibacillus sp.]